MKSFENFFTRAGLGMIFLAACSFNLDEKHFVMAEEFLRQGQYRRAIEEYSRVVNYAKNTPIAVQAQLQIASIYDHTLKDYPLAIRAYRDVVKRTEDKGLQMRALLAVCQIYGDKLEKPRIAAEEYTKLFETYGKNQKEGPEILLSLSKSLMDAGEFAISAQKYEEFRQLYPGHKEGPRTVYEQGQAYLADRQFEKAIASFQEVVAKFSRNTAYNALVGEAYFGLGSAFEGAGKMSEAVASFKEALPLYPNKKVIELKIDRVEKRKKNKAF